jgi:hypothetical protein
MEGIEWANDVVLFSTKPLGAPPELPLAYTLPGQPALTYTLLNLAPGGYDITVTRTAAETKVEVASGTTHTANSQGVLRFPA